MPVSGSGGRGGSACAGAGATCACFFQLEGDRAEFIVAPPPAHMHTAGKEGGDIFRGECGMQQQMHRLC